MNINRIIFKVKVIGSLNILRNIKFGVKTSGRKNKYKENCESDLITLKG